VPDEFGNKQVIDPCKCKIELADKTPYYKAFQGCLIKAISSVASKNGGTYTTLLKDLLVSNPAIALNVIRTPTHEHRDDVTLKVERIGLAEVYTFITDTETKAFVPVYKDFKKGVLSDKRNKFPLHNYYHRYYGKLLRFNPELDRSNRESLDAVHDDDIYCRFLKFAKAQPGSHDTLPFLVRSTNFESNFHDTYDSAMSKHDMKCLSDDNFVCHVPFNHHSPQLQDVKAHCAHRQELKRLSLKPISVFDESKLEGTIGRKAVLVYKEKKSGERQMANRIESRKQHDIDTLCEGSNSEIAKRLRDLQYMA